jgi:hypothetical protein
MLKYIILLYSISLFSNSKGSLEDRKKNFDSRANQIINISNQYPSEKLGTEIKALKDSQISIDAKMRTGDRENFKQELSNSEAKLKKLQREFSAHLKEISKELLDEYSLQSSSTKEKEKSENKKLTVDEVSLKEKSSQYFSISNTDFANGIKFERDSNLSYAIQLFKRSIDFSILAFKTNKMSLPSKFDSNKKNTEDELKHVSPKEKIIETKENKLEPSK